MLLLRALRACHGIVRSDAPQVGMTKAALFKLVSVLVGEYFGDPLGAGNRHFSDMPIISTTPAKYMRRLDLLLVAAFGKTAGQDNSC